MAAETVTLNVEAAAMAGDEHAKYEEFEASVGVDGELLIGSLPQKQMKILVGWLAFHEEEGYAAWELAVQGKHFDKIVAKI